MDPKHIQNAGAELDVHQVYLQAVTLLKNQINERWEVSDDSSADKENVSQNSQHTVQAPQISEYEKNLVK
jgi:hypothetical protein